jgi:hypothetical protein
MDHSKFLNKSTLVNLPGTLLMKDQVEIDVKLTINVMDKENVLLLDGVQEFQDHTKIKTMIMIKL